MKNYYNRPVCTINEEYEIAEEYSTIIEAAEKTGLKPETIYRAVLNKRKSGGKEWAWNFDNDDLYFDEDGRAHLASCTPDIE
jgi:hypothetical protein